ncbi:MAG: ABC transporter permease subunit [Alphaproteobacteria bacterium]|nr:ABC transporter permease subunit [Alphaproteobacteria bacterium]
MNSGWSRGYVVLAGTFILAPLLVVVAVAFTSASFVSFPPPGWSLRWLAKVLADPAFMRPLGNSLVLAALAASGAALLAVPAALALARGGFRGAAEIESFLLSPLSLPALILSLSLLFFLARIGLGGQPIGLWIGHVVVTIPYMLRTVLATYRGVDRSAEEAAMTLGATPLRVFLHVTLPMIRPGILAGGLFAFLVSFDEVAIALLLSTMRTATLPVAILNHIAHNYDPAVAAISLINIALVTVAMLALEFGFGLDRLMLSRGRK